MVLIKLIILLIMMKGFSDGLKILAVYSVPSISHHLVFRPLTNELLKNGHQVTVVTSYPEYKQGESPKNLTEIDLHDVSYKMWKQYVEKADGKREFIEEIIQCFEDYLDNYEAQLKSSNFAAFLKKREKFDLVIVEACVRYNIGMSHLFKAPLVQISSFLPSYPNYENVGSLSHPLLDPHIFHKRIHNLSIIEKLNLLRFDYKFMKSRDNLLEKEDELLKRNFGDDCPTVLELTKNIEMLILNVHPMWAGNKAVPPAVVYLGGLHLKPEKPLPEDLKSYLDASKHGVIYMSFGTNVDPTLFPAERIEVFCNVFRRLPYDVLWKWNEDELPGRPDNVRIFKWLPQADLLRHPNIKLFITQAGLQSVDEAIEAVVPMVAIPALFDQWYNAEKVLHLGVGLKIMPDEISEENLMNAVRTVIEEPRYRQTIMKIRSIIRDRPTTSLQLATKSLELVAKRGIRHLKSPHADLPLWQYIVGDVLVLVGILGAVLMVVIGVVVCYIFKVCSRLCLKIKRD